MRGGAHFASRAATRAAPTMASALMGIVILPSLAAHLADPAREIQERIVFYCSLQCAALILQANFGASDQQQWRCANLQPRSAPPVRLVTSVTILAATASISLSVMVFSRGCNVTAMAMDFLPGSMPSPS